MLILLSACGKVGDPQPPFIRIPEAVRDLAATQSGYDLILSWTNPPRYIDGSAATNLARVHIRRGDSTVATVDVAAAGQGQSFTIPVTLPVSSSPQSFSVIVETKQGKTSLVSNTASVTPVDVPGRVSGFTGFADQRQIFLKWAKPMDHPEFADAYIIVRTDLPAEPQTITETHYEDPRYPAGKTLTYQITPVRRIRDAVVMGVGPESTMVIALDKTAPSIPSGLDVVASDTGAFLIWTPNPETDLQGYRVFRSDRADSGFTAVSEKLVTNSGYFDPSYRPGLYYAVSAVDDSGNESARSMAFRGP